MTKKELEAEVTKLKTENNLLIKLAEGKATVTKVGDYLKLEEPKLEVGKWYYSSSTRDTVLTCHQRIDDDGTMEGYGFFCGKWEEEAWHYNNVRPATPQEVETALIAEAKKRGFIHECLFNEIADQANGGIDQNHGKVGGAFDMVDGVFYTYGYGRWCIFKDGKWATIIEDKPPVVNGYDMEIKDGLVKFGCAVLFRSGLIELNEVIQLSEDSFNSESAIQNRKIKSITLDSDVTISVDQLKEIVDYIDKSK